MPGRRGLILRLFTAVSLVAVVVAAQSGGAHAITCKGVCLTANPVKISINQEGIYQVTGSELENAGIDLTGATSAGLGLTDGGVDVPIFVSASGSGFASSDYIEFYAHPVNNTYNSTNVYMLTDDGSAIDHVSTIAAGTFSGTSTPASNYYLDTNRTSSSYLTTYPGVPAYTTDNAWPSDGDPHWNDTFTATYSSPPPQATDTEASSGFSVYNVDSSGTCSITVNAVGVHLTSSPTSSASYQLSVTINKGASNAATVSPNPFPVWSGNAGQLVTPGKMTGTFLCSALNDAASSTTPNVVSFENINQSGTDAEILIRDFQISYAENLCARAGQLSWQGPAGGGNYSISGFSSAPAGVWRVAGSSEVMIQPSFGTGTSACGGTTSYTFSDTGSAPSAAASYFATSSPLTPLSIAPADMTDILSGSSGSAGYLIISNPEFMPTASCPASPSPPNLNCLVAYHESYGFANSVKIVSVNAIYDQYNEATRAFDASHGSGQVNPEAIQAYINYAYKNFGTIYVLLVGNDTIDYHNYIKCPPPPAPAGGTNPCPYSNPNNLSLIPSLYVNSTISAPGTGGVVPSDNMMAVAPGSSSSAPQVAIGRFPVNNLTDLQTEITKTIHWTGSGSAQSHNAIFGAMPTTSDATFQSSSNAMIGDLPAGFNATTYYQDGNSTDEACTIDPAFISAFDAGPELVNYSGHGDPNVWATPPNMLAAVGSQPDTSCTGSASTSYYDVQHLTNDNKPSLVFQWGCQTDDYAEVRTTGVLGTMLVNATDANTGAPDGGVLSLGSTGSDQAYEQAVLAGGEGADPTSGVKYFFGYLANGDTVGVALQKAKDDIMHTYPGDQDYIDVVDSYEILGDPALSLVGAPTSARLFSIGARVHADHTIVRWHLSLRPAIVGFNLYRRGAVHALNRSLLSAHAGNRGRYRVVLHGRYHHLLLEVVESNGMRRRYRVPMLGTHHG